MPEPLQNVSQASAFKVGDWVKCKPTKKYLDGKFNSAGWEPNIRFQVHHITQCSEGYHIYWPSTGNGVFEWDFVAPTDWDE